MTEVEHLDIGLDCVVLNQNSILPDQWPLSAWRGSICLELGRFAQISIGIAWTLGGDRGSATAEGTAGAVGSAAPVDPQPP